MSNVWYQLYTEDFQICQEACAAKVAVGEESQVDHLKVEVLKMHKNMLVDVSQLNVYKRVAGDSDGGFLTIKTDAGQDLNLQKLKADSFVQGLGKTKNDCLIIVVRDPLELSIIRLIS